MTVAQILRTDGSIKEQRVASVSDASAAATIGAELRGHDDSVAAVRFDSLPGYTWTGHYTDAHAKAKAEAEKSGRW